VKSSNTDGIGYFSLYKRDPKTKFADKYSLYLQTCVRFYAFQNWNSHKEWEIMRKFDKKFEKKVYGNLWAPILELHLGLGS
jgi:hypothetical protein